MSNNLNVPSEKIIFTVKNIMHDAKVMSDKDMELKYGDFKTSFEKLYDMSINSVINDNTEEVLDMLSLMLTSREEVKNNTKAKLHVDMYVGNKLGEKYIYPKTEKPSDNDMRSAFEKISRRVELDEEEGKAKSQAPTKPIISEDEYCDRGYEY